jgi:hypothetical protein
VMRSWAKALLIHKIVINKELNNFVAFMAFYFLSLKKCEYYYFIILTP